MSHDKHETPHEPLPHTEFKGESPAHERTDASAWTIVKVGIGLTILVIATDFALRSFTNSLQRHDPIVEEPVTGDPDAPITPPPRLQRSEGLDMKQLLTGEKERLDTYGWVDAKQKIVRVPINAAMQMIAEKGLPRWPKPAEKQAIPRLEQVPPDDGTNRPTERQP
jgi:hypothetical protein